MMRIEGWVRWDIGQSSQFANRNTNPILNDIIYIFCNFKNIIHIIYWHSFKILYRGNTEEDLNTFHIFLPIVPRYVLMGLAQTLIYKWFIHVLSDVHWTIPYLLYAKTSKYIKLFVLYKEFHEYVFRRTPWLVGRSAIHFRLSGRLQSVADHSTVKVGNHVFTYLECVTRVGTFLEE
jgi:hypothetical protein